MYANADGVYRSLDGSLSQHLGLIRCYFSRLARNYTEVVNKNEGKMEVNVENYEPVRLFRTS